MILATTPYRAIGAVIGLAIVVGGIAYYIYNWLSARDEIGSEIELAANRKPYLDDEDLEGPKLDKALSAALFLTAVSAVGLPVYWLAEPGRMEGAEAQYEVVFTDRGTGLYEELCSSCHGGGGAGGVAANFVIADDNGFQDQVNWLAPELTTVLSRFSEEEVTEILNYGRPPTPMPAWGAPGGGPLTEQQVEEIIYYLRSIQISPEEAQAQATEELARTYLPSQTEVDGELVEVVAADENGWDHPGEALFNLGLESDFAQGAFSCGRCHTDGWSIAGRSAIYGPDGVEGSPDDHIPFNPATAEPGPTAGGALGPNLWNVTEQFDDAVAANGRPLLLAWGPTDYEAGDRSVELVMPLELESGDLLTVMVDAPVVWSEPTEDELAEATAAAEEGSTEDVVLPSAGWALARYDNGEVVAVDELGRPLDVDGEPMVDGVDTVEAADLGSSGSDGDMMIVEYAVIGAGGELELVDGELAEVPEDLRTFSEDQVDFITAGGERGRPYGNNGNDAWQMPGFGGLYTQSQIAAIVDFERSLEGSDVEVTS